ncbi:MAG TPA: adenylate/guanylate cyclase domain-containing protein [Mycobacterium sp.]|nr:adenylate/guanylate cyclase domain-containing protein [Mycobacterium sp.]
MNGDESVTSINELLDDAVAAINRGQTSVARELADRVLDTDAGNLDAESLLATPADGGEMRRLTILFADLVDSTALSTRIEPERYRTVVGRYRERVSTVVNRLGGHVISAKGDGLLVTFGHPVAHEDDVHRAVLAGGQIVDAVKSLSTETQRNYGFSVDVRVGVHRGLVYLDVEQDDVYGFAANIASRLCALAAPGNVVVSEPVAGRIAELFDLERRPPAPVRGIQEPLAHYRVVGERGARRKDWRGPLLGRDVELAALQDRWTQARSGTLMKSGMAFRGEPGIGKSRMVFEAITLAERDGVEVVELHGSPMHSDIGLHPLRGLIETRCGITTTMSAAERLHRLRTELISRSCDPAAFVPMLAPILGIEPDAGYAPIRAEGRKLYEQIVAGAFAYLLACVDGGGLVVVEDAQWLDRSSVEIISALFDQATGHVLVVLTGRDGEEFPWDSAVEVFELEPLSEEHATGLVTTLNPELPADAVSEVVARCDGIPFYIEQVAEETTPAGVPEALYEPLTARLRGNSEVVRVVQAAAVIGRQFERAVLEAVVDLEPDVVNRVLSELENAKVLERYSGSGWRFRHELLREVCAELAPPTLNRQLHRRVADALAGTAVEVDWPLAASHYELGGRFNEAFSAYRQAAVGARRRGALAEAREYLNRAVAGLDREPAGRDRDRREIGLRLERGFLSAAADGSYSATAAPDFERCLELSGTDLNDDELFATLTALLGYYVMRADLARAKHVVDSLDAGLEQGRQWFRPIIDASFGVVSWLRGEFGVAEKHLARATEMTSTVEPDDIEAVWFVPNDPIATAHIFTAWTRLIRGECTGIDGALADAGRRAATLGFPQGPYSEAFAQFVSIWAQMERGRFDAAGVAVSELLASAEQHGFDQWLLGGATEQAANAGLAGTVSGDVDMPALSETISTLTVLLDTWEAVGAQVYRTYFDAVLGQLLINANRLDDARERLDFALKVAERTGMHFYDAELLRLRAKTHADADSVHSDVTAALALARAQQAHLFELRAALDYFDLGDPAGRDVLRRAVERVPVDGGCPELARARAVLKND